ncbi:MAG TPA: hypothetical protein VFB72_09170 [Verrucomicrobiae bacterium]|nr:hypothetical protein [Verrucomicrobiae bacterium]
MTGQIIALHIATGVLFAVVAWQIWRVFSRPDRLPDHPAYFFVPVFLCLLFIRIPHISWPNELNVDESQMLAQAMRFLVHPVPWKDVDGTTSGPLNSLVLSVPIYFGAPADWQTSRTVLWALECVTLVFLYLAMRAFGSRAEAQLALLPTILFYAFPQRTDYIHYSSETVPVLLISAGLWMLVKEWNSERASIWRMFLTGCLTGMIPFAKLQAAPLAVFLLIVALMLVRFKNVRGGQLTAEGWQLFAAIVAGGMLVPGLILGIVFAKGAFGDFWISYILASAAYSLHQTASMKRVLVWILLTATPDFTLYVESAVAALVLLLVVCRGRITRLGRQLSVPLIVVLVQIVLTLLCIYSAGKGFLHYNFLLVPPLALLFGLACVAAGRIAGFQNEAGSKSLAFKVTFAAVCVIGFQVPNVPAYFYFAQSLAQSRDTGSASVFVKSTLAATQPGESMAIWGWMPSYYVETGLYPGTRDAVGHYVISMGPYQNYFRSRFLRDMEQNRPVLFVDAVAGGVFLGNWGVKDGHESFPELANFIHENYSLYLTIRYMNSKTTNWPVRLYVLKERMAERQLKPTELMLPELKSIP